MTEARRHHAALRLDSRRLKALKIEKLLALSPALERIRLLEVGTGSGAIAHHFGCHPALRCEVEAVDVVDVRKTAEGFRFQRVEGTKLPFPDCSFDVVISNHVIEHVGGRSAQSQHLSELARVVRPGGIGYLAVPSRWMLVEPHYKLALLSWLPPRWRSPYLRWRKGVADYDCEPLTLGELEQLLAESAWRFENAGIEAVSVMRQLEAGNLGLTMFDSLPLQLKKPLRAWLPTHIYKLSRPV